MVMLLYRIMLCVGDTSVHFQSQELEISTINVKEKGKGNSASLRKYGKVILMKKDALQ